MPDCNRFGEGIADYAEIEAESKTVRRETEMKQKARIAFILLWYKYDGEFLPPHFFYIQEHGEAASFAKL